MRLLQTIPFGERVAQPVEPISTARAQPRPKAQPFRYFAETPSVEIRIKGDNNARMHLKSYQIDGPMLRTGAANFCAFGLKRKDNDLVVIESAEAATAFRRKFETRIVSRLAEVIFETGYGPSGLPHIGTFGEVARTSMVRHAFHVLTENRFKTRLIAFSDDMDGLRKVLDNILTGILLPLI